MKRVMLTVAVAAALIWGLAGTGFCQDDEEMERKPRWKEDERGDRPEGKKRWKEMRGRGRMDEEDRRERMPGRDRMGGERGEWIERFLERLKDENPDKYEELMRLKEENPDLFREKLKEIGEFIKNRRGKRREKMDPETRERMKEIGELEKQSMELAKQYRDAETDEEKQSIAEDLKPLLVRVFDLKLLKQQKDVGRLEKKLGEFKAHLKKREGSRDKIIQNRFDELTGKTTHLKW